MRRLPVAAVVIGFIIASLASTASAQSRLERNVVYGMYSGLALLAELVPMLRPEVLKEPPKPGAPPHKLLGGDQVEVFERIAAGQVGLLVYPPAQTENIARQLTQ